eukprot:jgi/Mesvir1/10973/Mv07855-RA.1
MVRLAGMSWLSSLCRSGSFGASPTTDTGITTSKFSEACLSEPSEPKCPFRGLKSKSCDYETRVGFVNRHHSPVDLAWLDYAGKEIIYRTIKPGGTHKQQTYVTHPWVARDAHTKDVLLINGMPALLPTVGVDHKPVWVAIEQPPSLAWSPDEHHRFPHGFQLAARTLLLCHHRACQQAGHSPRTATANSGAACPPLPWLVRGGATFYPHVNAFSCMAAPPCSSMPAASVGAFACDGSQQREGQYLDLLPLHVVYSIIEKAAPRVPVIPDMSCPTA